MKWKVDNINEIGKKAENQDTIFPYSVSDAENSNLFLVCDGVGGSAHGEVASALVCEGYSRYFNLHPGIEINKQFLIDGLKFVRTRLVTYAEENPETEKMATTLTLVYFEEGVGAHVCWIGDSRVYHFKKGQIDYVTKDHSLVQKLLDEGELTEESAKDFKQKNVILRAIHANLEPLEMSYYLIPESSIELEDVIMLCSDGVMEAWTDNELEELMSKSDSVKEINNTISTKCLEFSRDNYSAYIISVNHSLKAVAKKKGKKLGIFLIVAILIASVVILILWSQKSTDKAIKVKTEIEIPASTKTSDTLKEIENKKKIEKIKEDQPIIVKEIVSKEERVGDHVGDYISVLETKDSLEKNQPVILDNNEPIVPDEKNIDDK